MANVKLLKLKDSSVNIWGLQVQMQPVLKEAAKVWEFLGKELVVTNARDGIHSPGSYHYYGLAIDLRTRYFTDGGQRAVELLRRKLAKYSRHYDIFLHSTHVHVEFDARKAGLI